MTPGSAYKPTGSKHLHNLQTKNVDESPKPLGFSGISFADVGYLGDGFLRTLFVNEVTAGDLERWTKAADEWTPNSPRNIDAAEISDAKGRAISEKALTDEEWAELDAEHSTPSGVADQLPEALAKFLRAMHYARRKEREAAILAKVGWEALGLMDLDPMALAKAAESRSKKYAMEFPKFDRDWNPINREPVHCKRRCEKWQAKRLRRMQRDALLYVEQAVGAVGGADVPGRPLYVSDYAISLHRQHEERTKGILENLRLVMRDDPSIQIPMLELNERAKIADVTKRRLLIDAMLRRWAELGWHVCWITITLPGRYVANSTNEERRVEEWDLKLGPQEALDDLQEMHHQTMNLLRERGVRPCGWWNAQPQQSGTPHRHIILACQTKEDARKVCDAFWDRFSSTKPEDRQEVRREDHGCSAYVIGDDDDRYAPTHDKNGDVETAASIAKYSARYSTRYETPANGDAAEDKTETTGDQERFIVWKSLRRVRGHTWMGLDSGRSPMELWDTLWVNAQRSEYDPGDPRMALALRLMRTTQMHAKNAGNARKAAAAMTDGDEEHDAQLRFASEESDMAARHAWHAMIALGMWSDTDLDPAEREWLKSETEEVDEDALPPMPFREERETIYGEVRKATTGCIEAVRRFTLNGTSSLQSLLTVAEELDVAIEYPSAKLRKKHIISALEDARHTVSWRTKSLKLADLNSVAKGMGITVETPKMLPKKGRVLLALRRAGFGFSKRPDGTIAGFDLSGELLLRTKDQWVIVDKDKAAEMVEDSKTQEFTNRILEREGSRIIVAAAEQKTVNVAGLSFSPTDPRYRPSASLEAEERVTGAPPG